MSAARLAAAAVALGCALPGAAPAHPGHGITEVDVGLYAFQPPRVDIVAGDVVFWTWRGPDTDHSVTGAGPGKTFDSDPGVPDSQVGHPVGHRHGEQFDVAGTYDYLCRKHPGMRGTVVVAPGATGVSPPLDRTAPRLTRVALVPARMCRRCRRPGARLRFTLSERAALSGAVRRVRRGATRVVRRVRVSGRPGRNDVRFRARGLRPGSYRLTLRAYDDAGNPSPPVTRAFRVR